LAQSLGFGPLAGCPSLQQESYALTPALRPLIWGGLHLLVSRAFALATRKSTGRMLPQYKSDWNNILDLADVAGMVSFNVF
jgi:hypothetical protein